jgi:hypothetical protein
MKGRLQRSRPRAVPAPALNTQGKRTHPAKRRTTIRFEHVRSLQRIAGTPYRRLSARLSRVPVPLTISHTAEPAAAQATCLCVISTGVTRPLLPQVVRRLRFSHAAAAGQDAAGLELRWGAGRRWTCEWLRHVTASEPRL